MKYGASTPEDAPDLSVDPLDRLLPEEHVVGSRIDDIDPVQRYAEKLGDIGARVLGVRNHTSSASGAEVVQRRTPKPLHARELIRYPFIDSMIRHDDGRRLDAGPM